MKIVINAIASTAGGGRTYLLNLLRYLPELGDHQYVLWAPPTMLEKLADAPACFQVRSSKLAYRGYPGRLWWEQVVLPRTSARDGAAAIVCVGNVAPLRSRLPVVLISANALYFSERFRDDLRRRGHRSWLLRHWFKGKMVVWSARSADAVLTPTRAMGEMLARASGRPLRRWRVSPFGHHEPPAAKRMVREDGAFQFLILSYYNYFRNFETVFHAMAKLRKMTSHPFRLLLTTELAPGLKLGGYDTSSAFELLKKLELEEHVEILGHVPYEDLGTVLGRSDALIAAGYVESFSFTVLEGIAAGLPVLASDIPAHRETGGPGALLFEPMNADDLAEQCLRLLEEPELRSALPARGRPHLENFDWRRHFSAVLDAVAEVAA